MTDAFDIPIIVLAAGASSRMRGADKLMQDVGGRPLLRRQAALARSATQGVVIVAVPPAPHPRHDALRGLDVTLLPVSDAAEGMNASLRCAVAALPKGAAAMMVLLGDLPDLLAEDLQQVMAARIDHPEALIWRGTTQSGQPGHPIIFDASLFRKFAHLRGDSGGREVLAAADGRVQMVPLPGQRARRDLDTPEDWAAWRAENRGH